MKRLFIAGLAAGILASTPSLAADRPVYKAPPAYAPIFTWSGCYIGSHSGWGWARSELDPTTPGAFTARVDPDGWFSGGQIGCNWQTTPNWVWGIEGDLSVAHIHASGPFDAPVAFLTYDSRIRSLGTARVRAGYAVDRALLYVTGGVAGASNRARALFGGVVLATDTETHFGWTIGAGVEWALWNNWSAKVEYLYMDLGTQNYGSAGFTAPIDLKVQTLKVGFNFRFAP